MSLPPLLSTALINSGLPHTIPHGPTGVLPERIMQFGGGNFLRAFADWMIDVANERGMINGRIVVVQSVSRDRSSTAEAQNGVYTVLTRGVRNGIAVEEPRIVTSVSRSLAASDPAHWAEVLKLAASPDLRFVLSNTTEAGIAFGGEALTPGVAPASFGGKLCAVLAARHAALGAKAPGLIMIPCELVERNGQLLRAAVLAAAAAWKLDRDLVTWIEQTCVFCDTLVDRIVPGGAGAEADTIAAKLGYTDRLLTIAEPYHLWAIDAPAGVREELPLDRLGLNVVWTNDLPAWRTKKVRVLNGAHTFLAMTGFAAGIDTVIAAMRDPLVRSLVTRLLEKEVAPTLPADSGNAAYVAAIIERFDNPFLQHALSAISLNSVSKWRVRLLPTLVDALAAKQPAPLMIASLAALIATYRGTLRGDRELIGSRNGQSYTLSDDPAALAIIAKHWAAAEATNDLAALVDALLGDATLWGRDLRTLGIAPTVTARLTQIHAKGMRAMLVSLNEE